METWRTSNVRDVGYSGNHCKLVVLDPKRDRLDIEAKLLNWVRIPWLHGLRILVDGVDLLMLAGIICVAIALGTLCEVLNRH